MVHLGMTGIFMRWMVTTWIKHPQFWCSKKHVPPRVWFDELRCNLKIGSLNPISHRPPLEGADPIIPITMGETNIDVEKTVGSIGIPSANGGFSTSMIFSRQLIGNWTQFQLGPKTAGPRMAASLARSSSCNVCSKRR